MRNIHGVLYTWADRKPIEDLLKHWGGTPVEHKPIIYVSGPSEHFLRMRNGKLSVKQAQPISDANRSIPTGGELEPQILTSRVHEEALPLPIPANRIHKEMYVQTPGTSRKLIYNVESLIENLANNPNYNLIRTDGNVTYRIGARGTGTKLDSPRGTITIGERVKVDIADLAFVKDAIKKQRKVASASRPSTSSSTTSTTRSGSSAPASSPNP